MKPSLLSTLAPAGAISPETVADRLVAGIIDRVRQGELIPGERLPSEEQLGREFEASRTAVREALQQLKAMGVVRVRVGSGATIAEGQLGHLCRSLSLYSARVDTVEDWSELLEMRILIETESALRLARKGTPGTLAPVWEALETMRRSTADLMAFAEADVSFHAAIVSASGNRLFSAVHQPLVPMTCRFAFATYRLLDQTGASLAEHEAIFEAMLAHDEKAAARLMKDHLEGSADRWLKRVNELGAR